MANVNQGIVAKEIVDVAGGTDDSTRRYIEMAENNTAPYYHMRPFEIIIERSEGVYLWDDKGRKFIDMQSASSAINQGHNHPRIVQALVSQASKLDITSRGFYTAPYCEFSQKITSLFGYEQVMVLTTGAEAVESAIKIARKWAYDLKGVPENKARILTAKRNFHGRTLATLSMSTEPDSTYRIGPLIQQVQQNEDASIPFDDVDALERALKEYGHEVAAFLIEPIQIETGLFIPARDYLARVQSLCKRYNVLFICDEIQTGMGRTGKLLAYQHDPKVEPPDIVTIGKALSGGMYPVSAVLSSREIMSVIGPGTHASTFSGNPLGCAVASAALDVIVEEKLSERADQLGKKFQEDLKSLKARNSAIRHVRGLGMLNVIELNTSKGGQKNAWDVCLAMKEKGVLAKPIGSSIIRLAPPLIILENDLATVLGVLEECLVIKHP